MIQVHVADNWVALGINIAIVQDGNGGADKFIMRFDPASAGLLTWQRIDDAAIGSGPSLRLGYDEAKALLTALAHFFDGAGDERQIRADLEHERKRSERFELAILRMLDRVTPDAGAKPTP